LYTGTHSQLVLMSLAPGEDIGLETHEGTDQFLRIEAGTGEALIDGNRFDLAPGSAVVIPAGAEHNVVNTSSTESLKLYTIYSPPEHPHGTINRNRAEALDYEKEQHG